MNENLHILLKNMSDLKICRICLRTEAKMYDYDLYQLKYYYEEVMAIKVNVNDGLPHYFCYECVMILYKFHKFKEKCYNGQKVLRELLWKGGITYESVYKIDRQSKYLNSNLSVSSNESNNKTFIIRIHEDSFSHEEIKKQNGGSPRLFLRQQEIINHEAFNSEALEHYENTEPNSRIASFVRIKEEKVNSKSDETDVENDDNQKIKNRTVVDLGNWRKYDLTEAEALKEFRKRADDMKYLQAEFKCTDCFRGFSKKSMLEGHRTRRHQETPGLLECRFCRIRYKWKCDLRKHMRQHYTKYECLRCDLVCAQESTMLYHEEYHSGVTRKCVRCDLEFRHASTYYSHMRTHRSAHVCVSCGASYVSRAGLQQHRKLKHVHDDADSLADEDRVASYCETCDVTFESRRAYDEHLFHSAKHCDEQLQEKNEDIAVSRKTLSKSYKAKMIPILKRRKETEDIFLPNVRRKRKKNLKRTHRKPTTCYQCGEHFDTQAACLRHHLAQHPRTSFFSPAERHICEICGASLAPGSVAMHVNLHTRQHVHTCGTCGKQFHMLNGLKRHLVTHTGEKKFSCPLCDKRFTQSNSMKLHYKTFHLKQPYPKRNRRKNKEEHATENVEESSNDVDSDSLPEPGEVHPPGIQTVHGAPPVHDEPMDYMRL